MELFSNQIGKLNRYRKFLPAAAFLLGFTWDSLTLKRIDQIFDNVILLLYLLCAGTMILVVNLVSNQNITTGILLRHSRWLPFVMQFFFGGLFSAYVVFYFKSASLTQPSMFLLLLAALLIANEFLESRMTNIYLQTALYSMVTSSFFIFFLPVVAKRINLFTFLTGAFSGLVLTVSLIFLLRKFGTFSDEKQFRKTAGIPVFMFVILILFYSFNWIPPVPLALKYAGMYHNVEKIDENGSTRYNLTYEKPPWYRPWVKEDEEFSLTTASRIYCFSAVFATTDLKAPVYHIWQRKDTESGEWETADRIELPIRGGRDDGYRLYSYKSNIRTGKWRVEIRIRNGALLGRKDFLVTSGENGEAELVSTIR